MNINIPPDSQDWLFAPPDPDHDGALWSFRYPPPCEVDDSIYFRFDGQIVARARVCAILEPGHLDGFAHHGKRYLCGHKVCWLWSSFEDLRQRPDIVEQIEREQREHGRRRKSA
jgi:hypothetical protein